MSNTWFTSDSHWHHKNILDFARRTRRGEDVTEMGELLVETWNNQVAPKDIVYHAGDFSFGNYTDIQALIPRLNGEIHLILGNHDKVIARHPELRQMFASVQDRLALRIGKLYFVINHYPEIEWENCHYGWMQLHGHTHGGLQIPGYRVMDIGIDNRDDDTMKLWHLDEVVERLKPFPPLAHFTRRIIRIDTGPWETDV